MKNVNVIISAISLFVMTGCGGSRQVNESDGVITVDVTASYPQKKLILQDFMDVEYIPLETGGEFYCQGNVRAIGEKFIIVTNSNQINDGDIFIFDGNGSGLRKFNRKGRGGEEYARIGGVILDEDNNEIFVNDGGSNRIIVYDLYGRFKRSFQYKEGSSYRDVYNFDRGNLICRQTSFAFEQGTVYMPPFIIISKLDGSIVYEIQISFEQKVSTTLMQIDDRNVSVMPINYFSITPYENSWILMEPSTDTLFRFLPDYSLFPFITRTPSIQTMNTEVLLFPGILTDHYYFIQTIKKEFDFTTWTGLPKTNLVYDKQEKRIYECTVHNDDFTTKRPVDMVQATINNEISFWHKLEADELVEDYEKGVLKGKLKEIAANLDEEANPVIMLVRYKK